jgi:hypothetical protein
MCKNSLYLYQHKIYFIDCCPEGEIVQHRRENLCMEQNEYWLNNIMLLFTTGA